MSAVALRRLTYADLPQVMAIERRAFAAPWSLAMFVLELSKARGISLAAVDERRAGRVVAYLVCSWYEDAWHLMNLAVEPQRRREGIGTALLEALLAELGAEEARLTLEVRRSNTPAIALYERYGFRAAGVRPRYYSDNGEDAVIMWRTPATLRGSLEDVPA